MRAQSSSARSRATTTRSFSRTIPPSTRPAPRLARIHLDGRCPRIWPLDRMAGSHVRSDHSGEPMDAQQPTIGVLGLGAMGAPMTRRLLEAGKHVVISSRREKPDLVAAGATWAATPREVGAAADAVLLMLPDLPEVEEVL